jgi:formylglycine-generating enzyme
VGQSQVPLSSTLVWDCSCQHAAVTAYNARMVAFARSDPHVKAQRLLASTSPRQGLAASITLSGVVALLAAGCGASDSRRQPETTGAAGTSASHSAGTSSRAIGGNTSSRAGNTTTNAGMPSDGGAVTGGVATSDAGMPSTSGGTFTNGGATGTFGGNAGTTPVNSSGGTGSNAGAPEAGGAVYIGGAPSNGGAGSTLGGNANTVAGSQATGGTVSIGGTASDGGALAMGGSATGGSNANGAAPATGGVTLTGGSPSTGGSATGGVATGGTPATAGAATAGTPATGGVAPVLPPSCQGTPTLTCQNGATTESCCTAITVPGDTFPMGRSEVSTGSDYYSGGSPQETPEHSATVASFALDKYEVTVGRFRKFASAYDSWHAGAPVDNAGAHPIAANTGWGRSWAASTGDLPSDSNVLMTALKCNSSRETWTDAAAGNENYPINCVNWYEAFAFCIWDGGRLPTEAEWELAAAGGTNNYLYPWGSPAPDSSRANFYGCSGCPNSPFVAVGSCQAGNARWGHADLAGSMWEWAFDWYSGSYYGTIATPVECVNCANAVSSTSGRILRGGSYNSLASYIRVATRDYYMPSPRYFDIGFRCARSP